MTLKIKVPEGANLVADIRTEVCANERCGVMVALDSAVQVPEGVDLNLIDWPVFHCSACGSHTQVMTQKHKGVTYSGSYILAWAVNKPKEEAPEPFERDDEDEDWDD